MAKFKINWCENKTSKTGKAYMTATIIDEQEIKHDVSIWPDFPYYAEIKPGSVVEGVITEKGQYKNLTSGSRAMKPNSGYKEKAIAEAQAMKAKSISDAQDRSAWMWAKNNACMLYAHNPEQNNGALSTNAKTAINELATDIYNMEPSKPF